jgi:hypothetical protein
MAKARAANPEAPREKARASLQVVPRSEKAARVETLAL